MRSLFASAALSSLHRSLCAAEFARGGACSVHQDGADDIVRADCACAPHGFVALVDVDAVVLVFDLQLQLLNHADVVESC